MLGFRVQGRTKAGCVDMSPRIAFSFTTGRMLVGRNLILRHQRPIPAFDPHIAALGGLSSGLTVFGGSILVTPRVVVPGEAAVRRIWHI